MKDASPRNSRANTRRMRPAGALAFACFGTCLAAMSCICAQAGAPQSSATPSQAEIRAAFVFNFAKFTEWPPPAFAESTTPLAVCFLGADDVRSAFQTISMGKTVNGRPVVVREAKSSADIHDCQIVYVDPPSPGVIPGVLKNARQCSALAIGTSEDFLARGGMIKLVVENNRMRFDVNVGAAGRIKIRLSSKLLALARSVVDLPDPAGS
jgi:YfiR/HmsC-like